MPSLIPNPTPPYSSPPSPLPTVALLPPSLPSLSKLLPPVPIKPPPSSFPPMTLPPASSSPDYSSSTSIEVDAITEAELRENGFRTNSSSYAPSAPPPPHGPTSWRRSPAAARTWYGLRVENPLQAAPRDERVRGGLGGAGPVGFDTPGLDDASPLVFPETRMWRRCCRCGSDRAKQCCQINGSVLGLEAMLPISVQIEHNGFSTGDSHVGCS
ncbi:hypothetical protein ACLB2K_038172 [Fragaria x ananassa]